MITHPSSPPSPAQAGDEARQFTAFLGPRRMAQGSEAAIVRALRAWPAGSGDAWLVFDDATGAQVELDLRPQPAVAAPVPPPPRGAGRPKLGVVAREVTLLPRHWEWLSLQPGGASVALRKLVDEARRTQATRGSVRAAQERGYRFLQAIAGNLPGYEEALRALYRGDAAAFERAAAAWPSDIREHASLLAADAWAAERAS